MRALVVVLIVALCACGVDESTSRQAARCEDCDPGDDSGNGTLPVEVGWSWAMGEVLVDHPGAVDDPSYHEACFTRPSTGGGGHYFSQCHGNFCLPWVGTCYGVQCDFHWHATFDPVTLEEYPVIDTVYSCTVGDPYRG